MARYATVSVVSTLLTLGLLALFFGVLKLASAAWCNVFATAIATIPSYYLNRSWAWGKSGKSHLWREVMPFWVISFVSLVLSTGAVKLASMEAHHFVHSHLGVTIVVEFASLLTYAILWVGKYLLFNQLLFTSRAAPEKPPTDGTQTELAPLDMR